MEKARAETFRGHWIHDSVKGHTANSRKMAKAGWTFNPGEAEDSDIATCYYCGKSLDGWEAGDDPLAEHRKRMPKCPMFTAQLVEEGGPEPTLPDPVPIPLPPASSSSSAPKKQAKSRRIEPAAAMEEVTEMESDAPSQPAKRSRSKKAATTVSTSQTEDAEPEMPPPRSAKPNSSRSTSTTRKAKAKEAEPEVSDAPTKSKAKGKAKKTERVPTTDVETDAASVISRQPSRSRLAVSGSEAETDVRDDESVKTTGKKKGKKVGAKKKTIKKAKAPSVAATDDEVDVEMSEVTSRPEVRDTQDVEMTPLAPPRATMDSIGGWTSLQAANEELEEMARELHIEGEFAAIGKSGSSSDKKAKSSVAKPAKIASMTRTASSMATTMKDIEVEHGNTWDWREKSVGAKTATTEADEMTEEEEVEKSLAGDEDDERDEDMDDDPMLLPPASREPSVAPTTTSGTTRPKPTEARAMALRRDEDGEQSTPKARRTVESNTSTLVSRPLFGSVPAGSGSKLTFAIEAGSNPFLVSARDKGNEGGSGGSGGLGDLQGQFEAPTIPQDAASYEMSAEEREMTLEEWILVDVERRKEQIRQEGRRWIEGFLENAEASREWIRGL